MNNLYFIKKDHERIISFAITGDYCQYGLLMDNEIHSDEISQIMEYTLHRMIDAGFTDVEIRANSGMYIPTSDELLELEEFDEFTNVDLSYILGGLITSINY